jgi:phosphoglycerate kinase
MVIWNGTLGIAEVSGIAGAHAPFSHGTRAVAEAMIGPHNSHPSRPFSLIGGGDTSAYVEEAGLTDDFDHVSTGGGASLELMSGKKLPGIEALQNK